MFTGFATENTPAIQVWDSFVTQASSSSPRLIYLADDCAPIQFFRSGGTTADIKVYLPTACVEGRQIKIINCRYGSSSQKIIVLSSDSRGNGTNGVVAYIGAGQTVDFCYSKNCISFGSSSGSTATGWISLNQTFVGSPGANAVTSGGLGNAAFGLGSFVGGGDTNTASGIYSAVVGGNGNQAIANNSAVVGGSGCQASSTGSAVLGATNSSATGFYAVVVGGNSSGALNSYATVAGGYSNTALNAYSTVVGGYLNDASGTYSTVLGGSYGTVRSVNGRVTLPASANPITTALGVSQTSVLVLGRITSDATVTTLCSDNSAAGTTNQMVLPNNSAYTFQGTVIANVTGGGNTSGWKFEGVIKRGATAASTTLVAAVTPTVIAQDAGAAAWVVAVTADTTNGGIAVTVTGAAATLIRWVCKIETTEVTF